MADRKLMIGLFNKNIQKTLFLDDLTKHLEEPDDSSRIQLIGKMAQDSRRISPISDKKMAIGYQPSYKGGETKQNNENFSKMS